MKLRPRNKLPVHKYYLESYYNDMTRTVLVKLKSIELVTVST